MRYLRYFPILWSVTSVHDIKQGHKSGCDMNRLVKSRAMQGGERVAFREPQGVGEASVEGPLQASNRWALPCGSATWQWPQIQSFTVKSFYSEPTNSDFYKSLWMSDKTDAQTRLPRCTGYKLWYRGLDPGWGLGDWPGYRFSTDTPEVASVGTFSSEILGKSFILDQLLRWGLCKFKKFITCK